MAKFLKFKTQFAQVPNALLQDGRLSFKARGLWAYLQSLPEDWDFAVERIAEDGQDGKDSVRAGLRELEAAGYLSRRMVSIGAGGSETEYQLSVPVAENPPAQMVAVAENPPAGNPPADIVITNTQIADKQESQVSIETTAQAPGDKDINELVSFLKTGCEKKGWAYDRQDDRRFARHIMTAKEFRAQAEKCGMIPFEYAAAIFNAAAALKEDETPALPFWHGKITGTAAIYRNHAKVYNDAKEFKNKQAPKTRHYKTL